MELLKRSQTRNRKAMKRTHKPITIEDVEDIISMSFEKGRFQTDIAEIMGISQARVCRILSYYKGREDSGIAKRDKAIVDQCKEGLTESIHAPIEVDANVVYYPNYELRLLFGLIKLTLKPKK